MSNQSFYYIPFAYENRLAEAIAEWTAIPPNGWTIITGVYTSVNELITGNSIVQNVLRVDREKQTIKLGFENLMSFDNTQAQFMKLIGFTLEGDLDLYAPAFKEELMALNGVVCKNNNIDYIEFLNTITNATTL